MSLMMLNNVVTVRSPNPTMNYPTIFFYFLCVDNFDNFSQTSLTHPLYDCRLFKQPPSYWLCATVGNHTPSEVI